MCDADVHYFLQNKEEYLFIRPPMKKDSCLSLINKMGEFVALNIEFIQPALEIIKLRLSCDLGVELKLENAKVDYTDKQAKQCISKYSHIIFKKKDDDFTLPEFNNCKRICKTFRYGAQSSIFFGELSMLEQYIYAYERTVNS